MSSGSSKKVVYAAVAANFAIAGTKFFAAYFSGSSALFSEGIHSVVDTGNQALLLLGLHLSEKPPDNEHPFGHGKELYFWSLIVAVLLFGIGGGMAVYEGITHLRHPLPLQNAFWAYLVLGFATVFESASWYIAYREVMAGSKKSVWRTVRTSKDPSVFTVLLEDTAALAGLLIAFFGVFLSRLLNNLYIDGIASLLIGLMLCLVALLLARESRELLIGESADPMVIEEIRLIAGKDKAVVGVNRVLTMHMGPNDVLLNLEIHFQGNLPAQEILNAIARMEKSIQSKFPFIRQIFVEAAPLSSEDRSHVGSL
jgi:cation diffusion facilitator family transporter